MGQRKTGEKSNEITAIPELLKLLEAKGCIVTIDAMGCQKESAERIIAQDGELRAGIEGVSYALLKVKGTQNYLR